MFPERVVFSLLFGVEGAKTTYYSNRRFWKS